jgi:hypothetical protein
MPPTIGEPAFPQLAPAQQITTCTWAQCPHGPDPFHTLQCSMLLMLYTKTSVV